MDATLDHLKSLAIETGSLTHRNKRLLRLLRAAGFLNAESSYSLQDGLIEQSNTSDGTSLESVGIWDKKVENGRTIFVRNNDKKPEWYYWANVGRIGAKGTRPRVVLIGESVARGFLYDPGFNLAMVLESTLQVLLGGAGMEVIDLARTNLTIENLSKTATESMLLEPDIVVIFAGNNWHPMMNPSDLAGAESATRCKGAPGLKQYLTADLDKKVRRQINQICDFFSKNDVSVIWVVPEFNLGDWEDPVTPVPVLPNQDSEKWHELSRSCNAHFRHGDLMKAEISAKAIIAIDQGTNAAGPRLLRRISQLRGDNGAARFYSELARDAEGWNPFFNYSPRPLSSVQEAIREEGQRRSCQVVDLPKLVDDYLRGELPGRRLFLDYCHMSAEGINVSAVAIATAILKVHLRTDVPLKYSPDRYKFPTNAIEAETGFLAAVHNAHYHQSLSVVEYWCRKALATDASVSQCMRAFVDIQSRRVPMSLCKATQDLLEFGSSNIARYLMQQNMQRLDETLCQAILNSHGSVDTSFSSKISNLRISEHGIRSEMQDLLSFYYLSGMPVEDETAWTSRSFLNNKGNIASYCKAYWHRSKFVFYSAADSSAVFKITCRVASPGSLNGIFSIEINGHRQLQTTITSDWLSTEFIADKSALKVGKNEVVLYWPDNETLDGSQCQNIADALLMERRPEFYWVFGEIDSFLAQSN